jgi:hypothetical protein
MRKAKREEAQCMDGAPEAAVRQADMRRVPSFLVDELHRMERGELSPEAFFFGYEVYLRLAADEREVAAFRKRAEPALRRLVEQETELKELGIELRVLQQLKLLRLPVAGHA